MSQSITEKRKIENEAVFRKVNEKVQKERDYINELALEDNQPDLMDKSNLKLQYICECSDENCKSRIELMSNTFNKIHQNRKYFVITRGHESLEVEKIVSKQPTYTIVEKNVKPPESNPKLRKTDVKNV